MLHRPSVEASDDLIRTFLASLKDLRADAQVARSEIETVEQLRKLLITKSCTSPVLAGLPRVVKSVVEKALDGYGYANAEELKSTDAVPTISKADVGITWAEYGVANQGAIMEVAYDDAVKLASSLPYHHVALVSSKKILADVSQAMIEVGRIISSSPPERKPVISFISGPSKTGDIEMKLLYGVHGPNTLTVLVLDWP